MNFSLDKTEHYTLLKTNLKSLDQNQAEELTAMVKQVLEKEACKYLILNFETVLECNAAAVRELITLGIYLNQQGGLLIISNPHGQFTRLFDKAEIIFVPSDTEAIDYVFMDQLEKLISDSEEE